MTPLSCSQGTSSRKVCSASRVTRSTSKWPGRSFSFAYTTICGESCIVTASARSWQCGGHVFESPHVRTTSLSDPSASNTRATAHSRCGNIGASGIKVESEGDQPGGRRHTDLVIVPLASPLRASCSAAPCVGPLPPAHWLPFPAIAPQSVKLTTTVHRRSLR